MAKFYGQISGSGNTVATKTGTERTGLKVSAQSYDGSVIVLMIGDRVEIEISDTSSFTGSTYFYGTIEELKAKLSREV